MSTFFHCNSWAKWIRKIYETDPLTCSECGEPMRIIAFITDSREVSKILEHIGEQTSRAPPLMPADPVPSFSDFGVLFEETDSPLDTIGDDGAYDKRKVYTLLCKRTLKQGRAI